MLYPKHAFRGDERFLNRILVLACFYDCIAYLFKLKMNKKKEAHEALPFLVNRLNN